MPVRKRGKKSKFSVSFLTKLSLKDQLTAAGLSLLLVWLVFLIFGIVQKEEIARHAVADTKAELSNLETRKTTLQSNLDELNTPRGEEETLRETYGVAKPGEEVIVVVQPEATTTPVKLPLWRKVLGWFHL